MRLIPGAPIPHANVFFTNIETNEFYSNGFLTSSDEDTIMCIYCNEYSKVNKDIKINDLDNPIYVRHKDTCDRTQRLRLNDHKCKQ